MMNSKKPPTKVSNVMKMMNKMLYTVFAFQIVLLFIFYYFSSLWNGNNYEDLTYLSLKRGEGLFSFLTDSWAEFDPLPIKTYWVAYSHLIPISLYVVLEIIKIVQAHLIDNDMRIYDPETGY